MKKLKKIAHAIIYTIKEIWEFICYFLQTIKHKLFPKSLLGRFILIILLPLIFLQIVLFMVFFENHWRLISRRLAKDVVGEIATIAYTIDNVPTQKDKMALIKQAEDNLFFEIHFTPDKRLTKIDPKKRTDSILEQINEALKEIAYPYEILENLKQEYIFVSVQTKTGLLEIRVPQKRFFSTSTYVFLIWMIGTSILLFGIAFLFMKNQVRAVSRLAKVAENFGTGRPVESFKPEGATEVKQAGLAFLNMQNRISRYLMERTSMLSGVSHDLRTPLTRMKLQLSMTPVEGREDLLSDIEEMERMLEGYLAFARGEGKETPCKIEVSSLIQTVVEKLRKNGHNIDLNIEQKQEMTLRPNDFMRAITNILMNAHRYAHNAFVNVGLRNKYLEIIIDDDGLGIPDAKKKDVFKAFYRLDESRNTKTGGVGLGLTITRDIILAHGGEITLQDSPYGGLRVLLKLPL